MANFVQFVVNHWLLFLALVAILILIVVNEAQAQKNQAKSLSPKAAVDYINHQNAVVFDIRNAESFQKGHIIDALSISPDDLDQTRLDKYKNQPIILVCQQGIESGKLAQLLHKQGLAQSFILAGGMKAWQMEGLPIVKGK